MNFRLGGFLFLLFVLIEMWTTESYLREEMESYHRSLLPVFKEYLQVKLDTARFCEGRKDKNKRESGSCAAAKIEIAQVETLIYELTKPMKQPQLKRSRSLPNLREPHARQRPHMHQMQTDYGQYSSLPNLGQEDWYRPPSGYGSGGQLQHPQQQHGGRFQTKSRNVVPMPHAGHYASIQDVGKQQAEFVETPYADFDRSEMAEEAETASLKQDEVDAGFVESNM